MTATEDAVALGQREWALTFEHSPVGMALVHLDGTWGQVNRSLCDMLGYDADALARMTFQDITHPDDLDEDLGLLDECLAGVRHDYRMTKRYLHRDGRLVWGDLSVALVRADDGVPLHFVSQILDVTTQRLDRLQRESAMLELRAANQDLERFAGVISHDLKTPLTTARAALELLGDELGRPDGDTRRARVLARQAEGAAQRMSALVDALLAHETTAAGDREALRRKGMLDRVVLADVVSTATRDLDSSLQSSASTVVLAPALAAAPPVVGSVALLRTLLVNVVGNAVKYRDPSRDLTIEVDAGVDPEDAGWVRVDVRNDGPEIAPADRERVFGFLARGSDDDAGTRAAPRVQGFGIGLASCRRIVGWHGGRIWIEQPPGGGVQVSFTLPIGDR